MPTGQLKIFNWDGTGTTYDAFTEWGVSLEDGAIGNLFTLPPMKERVTNTSRLEKGRRVNINAPVYFDSREVTLEMHIIASNYTDFLTKYRAFVEALNASPEGIIMQVFTFGTKIEFRLQYLSCTQFALYGGTLGKFALRFIERYPSLGLDVRPPTFGLSGGEQSENENNEEVEEP